MHRPLRQVPLRLALLLLLLLSCPAGSAELGAGRVPAELGHGGLLLRAGGQLREAPNLSTHVEIEVVGLIARTRVTQRFQNPTKEWLEGVYVFPLPERSTVDSLRMLIGERIIEGRVEERARAQALYTQAKSEGRKASLLEQERSNIFTTSLANLGPGEAVEVVLTYQEDVRTDRGRFSLRFPMVVAPRFVPGERLVHGFDGTGWARNTDVVPDAARITPPVADPQSTTQRPVTITAEISAGFPLRELDSPTHPVSVRARRGNRYEVRLEEGAVAANADFVLQWEPAVGSAPSAALFREQWRGEQYILLMVLPQPDAAARDARVSRETIFVIDTSGSMGGASIGQARDAVGFALGTLQAEDAFNVIEFNSGFRSLFANSRAATSEAIARARSWVMDLDADGGTNMGPALEAALAPGPETRAVRQVIFVTDGAVSDERALFGVIERELGRSRLYTVGIGSAPNSHFMSKAAEFGRGTFTYISRPEEVAEQMNGLFEKIDHPVLHDLTIDWRTQGVEAWPSRIPDLYIGEPLVVAARLPNAATDGPGPLLRGRRGTQEIHFELPLIGGADHQGVAKLWARRKVAALMDSLQEGASVDAVASEVAGIGVRHQLVTRWSSLVAIDVTPTAPAGVTPDRRAVPSLLPKGWDFNKLFGREQRRSSPDPLPTTPPSAPPHGPWPGDPNARSRRAATSVEIGQPRASVQIGRLPQGGTPATLYVLLGSGLLAGASLVWRRPAQKRAPAEHSG